MDPYEYRRLLKEKRDNNISDFTETDLSFHLCWKTGKSKVDILAAAVKAEGKRALWAANLGYSPLSACNIINEDGGYWKLMVDWIKQYLPAIDNYYREERKRYMNALVPDKTEILLAMANHLGIPAERLQMYLENHETMEKFYTENRRIVAVMAEDALWKIIAKGEDAVTIRWALERLNPATWGKIENIKSNEPVTINVVEE